MPQHITAAQGSTAACIHGGWWCDGVLISALLIPSKRWCPPAGLSPFWRQARVCLFGLSPLSGVDPSFTCPSLFQGSFFCSVEVGVAKGAMLCMLHVSITLHCCRNVHQAAAQSSLVGCVKAVSITMHHICGTAIFTHANATLLSAATYYMVIYCMPVVVVV